MGALTLGCGRPGASRAAGRRREISGASTMLQPGEWHQRHKYHLCREFPTDRHFSYDDPGPASPPLRNAPPQSHSSGRLLPVEDLPELPILHWEEFHGRNSNDILRGDWSRAAYSLVWVELDFNPGCHVTTRNLDDVPGEGQTWDTARFPQPWALPFKVELQGAL